MSTCFLGANTRVHFLLKLFAASPGIESSGLGQALEGALEILLDDELGCCPLAFQKSFL